MELNFDEFKTEGLHQKHAVATWNLGTISAFAKNRGNQERLYRDESSGKN
jgi:hypothetical protein